MHTFHNLCARTARSARGWHRHFIAADHMARLIFAGDETALLPVNRLDPPE